VHGRGVVAQKKAPVFTGDGHTKLPYAGSVRKKSKKASDPGKKRRKKAVVFGTRRRADKYLNPILERATAKFTGRGGPQRGASRGRKGEKEQRTSVVDRFR